jgi:hypothetical protein
MRQTPNANHRLGERILRALKKIKKLSTAEEMTELLNRDLGLRDRPIQAKEVATWLRNAADKVAAMESTPNVPSASVACVDL